MKLEQASGKAGPGGRIRFTEWPAGIYWIVPTNELMTYDVEFPNDSCADKAILTPRLLNSDKWEVVAPEIEVGDEVFLDSDIADREALYRVTEATDSRIKAQLISTISIPKEYVRFHSRPEKPETLVFEGIEIVEDGGSGAPIRPVAKLPPW